jgi:hypothetical protein
VGTLGVEAASAHICTYAAQIALGTTQTVAVGITVETHPVTDFVINVPSELHIDRIDPAEGFHITRKGQTLRYQGGPIQPYTCQYVTLGVTAHVAGVYIVPQTQRTAEGTVVARMGYGAPPPDPKFMQLVYAGIKPPPSPSSGGSSTPGIVYLGIALILFALGMLVFFGVRAWRARRYEDEDEDEEPEEEGDDELAARVARFKKQARDRVGKP